MENKNESKIDKTEIFMNLSWNKDYKCVEVMRVIFAKATSTDFILDKTQKIVQDAGMRAEPGKDEGSSQDCNYIEINQKGGKIK